MIACDVDDEQVLLEITQRHLLAIGRFKIAEPRRRLSNLQRFRERDCPAGKHYHHTADVPNHFLHLPLTANN